MDFALQPGAVLEVALLTPTGEPWPADASVSADWNGGPRARRPGKADEWDDASAWIAGKRRSAWDRALAGGKLRAAGLSAGSYRVVFQDEHGWLAECMVETGQPAAVVRAGTYLSARGALQVRAGSSDAAANQEGCRLVLRRRDERGLGGGLTRRLSPAHPVALYRGLEAGRWELRAMGTDSEAIVRQELVIHADQTLDFALYLPPGRTGTLALLAADGTPLPDAWVVVLDAAGNRLPQGEHDEAVTDAAGRARLNGLPLDDGLQIEVRRPDGGVVRTALGAFDPALGVWSAALPR
jgi:hypothetical protein